MGMHHSGAQGANSSSGSKRNTFTRSLSNADVPPDEKAGKFKNVLIAYRKGIYICYILYICNVPHTGNLNLLQNTNCCLSQLLCIVYGICIFSRSVLASSARSSTNVSYICFAGDTGDDANIVLKCVYLKHQLIIVIKGCWHCITNTNYYISHMEGTCLIPVI